ncbi:DnaJ subfamily B member 5 [Tritrichomonas foetus]|uniref:DnaJ subfamily B member 5 n=1 Tax=Tritrichomonas foetus TaxID=1144522 RepID=A0A1J4KEQ1_9EUKA|nr:DnaJ subfamily B member 5 [Tritrichomonas foetus]|eukprot:OHT08228.1 DnaJ subfamily B member 5 [Tritrichomonas foetus]
MGKDYYQILEIPRTADANEIKKAYRRLAMKWHPDKNRGNEEEASKKFQEISEAYEILSDPEKKRLFDKYGEEGLRGPGDSGTRFQHLDPNEIFRQFFGGEDPFASFGAHSSFHSRGFGSPFGGFFRMGSPFDDDDFFSSGFSRRGPAGPPPLREQAPLQLRVSCTLEQLFKGDSKNLRITKKVNNDTVESIIKLDILPGTLDGTKFKFTGQGNIIQGYQDQDVIFIINQMQHSTFARDRDNLICNASISIKQALCGVSFEIQGIDGVKIPIQISDQVIKPGTSVKYAGQGMTRRQGGRGDLYVKFDVVYPDKIDPEIKDVLLQILPD